jgi:hypothetical protein
VRFNGFTITLTDFTFPAFVQERLLTRCSDSWKLAKLALYDPAHHCLGIFAGTPMLHLVYDVLTIVSTLAHLAHRMRVFGVARQYLDYSISKPTGLAHLARAHWPVIPAELFRLQRDHSLVSHRYEGVKHQMQSRLTVPANASDR